MAQSLLRVGHVIPAQDGHPAYRIEQLLGQGGFGQAFVAEELTRTGRRRKNHTGRVCLKVTTDATSWHGETYFGLLTKGLSNVRKLLDSFPYRTRTGMRYVLVMELMTRGTVQDLLDHGAKPWTAGQVTNALRPLARTIGALHASGAMHRDITPSNVFVRNRKTLCLGDFGIARHGIDGKGPRADYFNCGFVATSIAEGRTHWLPCDDTYQIGLLGLSLLLGEDISDPDWRTLRHEVTDKELGAVLQRATGPRHRRFLSGHEMCEALSSLRS